MIKLILLGSIFGFLISITSCFGVRKSIRSINYNFYGYPAFKARKYIVKSYYDFDKNSTVNLFYLNLLIDVDSAGSVVIKKNNDTMFKGNCIIGVSKNFRYLFIIPIAEVVDVYYDKWNVLKVGDWQGNIKRYPSIPEEIKDVSTILNYATIMQYDNKQITLISNSKQKDSLILNEID